MIFFTDGYLFYQIPTLERKTYRIVTILHEISHMWFGNMVTMKWWDDIWLNESFASYIAHFALEKL